MLNKYLLNEGRKEGREGGRGEKTLVLEQWFSTEGNFLPRGYLTMSEDIFDCHDWEGGCHWHLVDRGQGCC